MHTQSVQKYSERNKTFMQISNTFILLTCSPPLMLWKQQREKNQNLHMFWRPATLMWFCGSMGLIVPITFWSIVPNYMVYIGS